MTKRTLPDRFWIRVEKSSTCWKWTGATNGGGYGAFTIEGTQYRAHRLSFEDAVGPIPDGLDLDHLCRNRACVRPDHLEPVTRVTNLLRSPITITALNAAKTRCVNGHEFTSDNTLRLKNGTRRCRTCRLASVRAWKAKNRL